MSEVAARKELTGWRLWLRRLAPWVVAGIAIALVLRKYPADEIAREMQKGNVLAMLPFAAALLTVGLMMVATADYVVIRGCSPRPRYWVAVRGKTGATLLNLVGYSAQVGGYGVWIARVTGLPAAFAGGVILYILSSELTAVALVASASVWIGGADVPQGFRVGVSVIPVVLVVLKLVGPFNLMGDRAPRLFLPWRYVLQKRSMLQVSIRTAHIYWMVLCTWGAANAFGLDIPLSAMTTYMPIVLVVGSMPVNVAGFGAVQGAWLLLTPWASGERLLAFAVVWQLVLAIGTLARGLPFIRQVVGEIAEGKRSQQQEADATARDAAIDVEGAGG